MVRRKHMPGCACCEPDSGTVDPPDCDNCSFSTRMFVDVSFPALTDGAGGLACSACNVIGGTYRINASGISTLDGYFSGSYISTITDWCPEFLCSSFGSGTWTKKSFSLSLGLTLLCYADGVGTQRVNATLTLNTFAICQKSPYTCPTPWFQPTGNPCETVYGPSATWQSIGILASSVCGASSFTIPLTYTSWGASPTTCHTTSDATIYL